MRARTLRKKEAFKKQTETQKALGTATAAPMKCEDEKQVADGAPGDVPSATPGVSPVNVGSTAVPKKKVYSVKIEESAENTEMEPR